jgi:hypothetical protein
MQSKATTVEQYVSELPADRQATINALRKVIKKNLPKGFQECMGYGMLGYVVPHSTLSCRVSLQSKRSRYHLWDWPLKKILSICITWAFMPNQNYTNGLPKLMQKLSPKKLDMGKSCVRYKKAEDIPLKLIGELASKDDTSKNGFHYMKLHLKKGERNSALKSNCTIIYLRSK